MTDEHEVYAVHHWSGSVLRCDTCGEIEGLDDEHVRPVVRITIEYLTRRTAEHRADWTSSPQRWPDSFTDAPRPGRRGREDGAYLVWAERYIEALGVSPRRPVVHLCKIYPDETGDSIRGYLNAARHRGLLTAAPSGMPGGELTEKAKAMRQEGGCLTPNYTRATI